MSTRSSSSLVLLGMVSLMNEFPGRYVFAYVVLDPKVYRPQGMHHGVVHEAGFFASETNAKASFGFLASEMNAKESRNGEGEAQQKAPSQKWRVTIAKAIRKQMETNVRRSFRETNEFH